MEKSDSGGQWPAVGIPRPPIRAEDAGQTILEPQTLQEAPPEFVRNDPSTKVRMIDLIDGVKKNLKALIGYPVDSISAVSTSESGWSVEATVVELSRVPTGSDVLAEYAVNLNTDGDIIDYRRGRRFYRNSIRSDE